jgi:hypothetical protein
MESPHKYRARVCVLRCPVGDSPPRAPKILAEHSVSPEAVANDHGVNDIAAIRNFEFGFYPGDEKPGTIFSGSCPEPIKMIAIVSFPGAYPLQRMR